jgi:hypothetical protein
LESRYKNSWIAGYHLHHADLGKESSFLRFCGPALSCLLLESDVVKLHFLRCFTGKLPKESSTAKTKRPNEDLTEGPA